MWRRRVHGHPQVVRRRHHAHRRARHAGRSSVRSGHQHQQGGPGDGARGPAGGSQERPEEHPRAQFRGLHAVDGTPTIHEKDLRQARASQRAHLCVQLGRHVLGRRGAGVALRLLARGPRPRLGHNDDRGTCLRLVLAGPHGRRQVHQHEELRGRSGTLRGLRQVVLRLGYGLVAQRHRVGHLLLDLLERLLARPRAEPSSLPRVRGRRFPTGVGRDRLRLGGLAAGDPAEHLRAPLRGVGGALRVVAHHPDRRGGHTGVAQEPSRRRWPCGGLGLRHPALVAGGGHHGERLRKPHERDPLRQPARPAFRHAHREIHLVRELPCVGAPERSRHRRLHELGLRHSG
mmetsp:Transcript_95399/g.274733  ORF Transcript_95399/g.274733 Transcript_95399/m.274733 type:complete len:345 (+) Transcript_95399:108-1142(+)